MILNLQGYIWNEFILLNWLAAILFDDEVFPYNAKMESVVSLFFGAVVGWLKKLFSSVERPIIESVVCWTWDGDDVVDETEALRKLLNGSVESEPEDVNEVSINVGFESFVGVSELNMHVHY